MQISTLKSLAEELFCMSKFANQDPEFKIAAKKSALCISSHIKEMIADPETFNDAIDAGTLSDAILDCTRIAVMMDAVIKKFS